MDTTTAHKLNTLTTTFYRDNAVTFSATRDHAWPGWKRIVAELQTQHPSRRNSRISILDLGCGNLRFERFLATALPDIPIRVCALDSCRDLVWASRNGIPDNLELTFQEYDVIAALERGTLTNDLSPAAYDCAVAFGFMHHIPLPSWRYDTLEALVESVVPGGIVAVSFWQFLNDDRLRMKADTATIAGCAAHRIVFDDPCDRLLAWQEKTDAFRYCHHFEDQELDELVSNLTNAHEQCRFSADGRADLNRYVILQRTG